MCIRNTEKGEGVKEFDNKRGGRYRKERQSVAV